MTKLRYTVRQMMHVSLSNAAEVHKATDDRSAVYRIVGAKDIITTDVFAVVRTDNFEHVYASFPAYKAADEHAKECQALFDHVAKGNLIIKNKSEIA